MFCVGDSVVYGLDGICTITAVSSLDLRDVPKDKLYYTLRPMDTVGVIYVPVDAAEGKIRKILTREKAVELIEKMPSVAPLSQVPEKVRKSPTENACKNMTMRSGFVSLSTSTIASRSVNNQASE